MAERLRAIWCAACSLLPDHRPAPPRSSPPAPLQKHTWTKGLTLRNFEDHSKQNERVITEIQELSGEALARVPHGALHTQALGGRNKQLQAAALPAASCSPPACQSPASWKANISV